MVERGHGRIQNNVAELRIITKVSVRVHICCKVCWEKFFVDFF